MIGRPASLRGPYGRLLACTIGLGCTDEPWPRPAAIPQEQFIAAFRREYRRYGEKRVQ